MNVNELKLELGLSDNPNSRIFKSDGTQGYWLEVGYQLAKELFENSAVEICEFHDSGEAETMIEDDAQLTDVFSTGGVLAIYLGDIRKEKEE